METETDTGTEKLLPYQIPHKYQLHEALLNSPRVLDASDTGTGKTYVAISLCREMGLRPFIICPKAVIPVWVDVCKYFKVNYLGVSNYEMLKNGKYYTENFEPANCPYMDIEYTERKKRITRAKRAKLIADAKMAETNKTLRKFSETVKVIKLDTDGNPLSPTDGIDVEDDDDDDDDDGDDDDTTHAAIGEEIVKDANYIFHLPNDVMIIFDEAHRCKNMASATNKLLIGLSKCDNKIIILSATITDKIECFRPFGLFFGFYDNHRKYRKWIESRFKLFKYTRYRTNILTQKIELDIIHTEIFPRHGSRMKIKDLGPLFPENAIAANCYYLDNHAEVESIYGEINNALRNLSFKERRAHQLAKITYARMKIEMLKVSLYIDLAREGIENNYSVAVFVNYSNTMDYICLHMEKYCGISIIKGNQTMQEREENIAAFQANRNRLMVAMIQAGGVGISLHDIHGGHPRMSIISPPFAGDILRQCLGRIHRAGSKTPAIQKIVYIAKTYEEHICQLIKRKLTTIDAINNGDLMGSGIEIDKEAYDVINNTDESSTTLKKMIKSKKDTTTKL